MILYLDTSSLVKLYVQEADSDEVRRLVGRAAVVATSDIGYAEARAALARRRREGALQAAAFTLAKRTLDAEWPRYLTIGVSPSLCREAGDLAERYELRGYDSVHLASFATIARQVGLRDARFSSADRPLNRAAQSLRRRLATRARGR